jgi:hypothetical protein
LSVGIGHASSKEAQHGLSVISGLPETTSVDLAERVIEALGEDLFGVFRTSWCLWTWYRIGQTVHVTE